MIAIMIVGRTEDFCRSQSTQDQRLQQARADSGDRHPYGQVIHPGGILWALLWIDTAHFCPELIPGIGSLSG